MAWVCRPRPRGYELVSPPQPTDAKGKVEVLEFFHYGCPHCKISIRCSELWVKKLPADVGFTRVPVTWGNLQLTGLAKLFLTLETTGDHARLHGQVFDAVSPRSCRCTPRPAPRSGLSRRVSTPKKFAEAYRSFSVNVRLKRIEEAATTRSRACHDWPSTASTSPSASIAGSHEARAQAADQLIVRARGEQGRNNPPVPPARAPAGPRFIPHAIAGLHHRCIQRHRRRRLRATMPPRGHARLVGPVSSGRTP